MGVGLAESGVAVRGVVVGVGVHLRGVARRASALHALAVGRSELGGDVQGGGHDAQVPLHMKSVILSSVKQRE